MTDGHGDLDDEVYCAGYQDAAGKAREEIASLRSKLEEAKAIIQTMLNRDDAYRFVYRMAEKGEFIRRAHAFLKEHENE